MNKPDQLTLSVQLPDDETFTSFKSDSNQVVVNQLQLFVQQTLKQQQCDNSQQNEPASFYLFGTSAVGKSHLLHAASSYATDLGLSTLCLSCYELVSLSVDVLEGLEQINIICIDDIQHIAGDVIWQQAIFDLFNRVLEQGNSLIICGNESAKQLSITLPDLVSRLSWGYTEQLKPISDDEKIIAIKHRALQRGLEISDEVICYLLNHFSRDMTYLINTLELLDKASIKAQRKITIPFIKTLTL